MIDLHYDLLTQLYTSMKKKDFSEVIHWCQNYNKNNVNTVVANLYFMSKEEMEQELHQEYYQPDVDVVEMFRQASLLVENFVDPEVTVIKSIEGMDYVEDIQDLDRLKELGLQAFTPVWNESNRYGSGPRSIKGLTANGRALLWRAFELGIAVDFSHANRETFAGMIEVAKLAKEGGLDPICYASHSNCYTICPHDRNLTDEQLLQLKEIGGIVGVFSNRNFVLKDATASHIPDDVVKQAYVAHIKHIEELFHGLDQIALSTDDMTFQASYEPTYGECPIFHYEKIQEEVNELLSPYYNEEERYQLMQGNAQKLIDRMNRKQFTK